MIGELVTFMRSVLLLDDATFSAHVQARDALKRGLLLLVIVALLSGVFSFLGNAVNSFRQPEADFDAIQRQVEQQLELQKQFNPGLQDPEFEKYFMGSLREGFAIGADIVRLPLNASFLPHWLDSLLRALGEWLSIPLAWLGAWSWYALWVLLFAKLLGGRATLERMLAATSLFVVPHAFYVFGDLLNVMASIPTVGGCFGAFSGLIGLVAAVWGIAIYIKASATANEFSLGKASLAAFLPVLVAMALAGLVLLGAILVAVLGSR